MEPGSMVHALDEIRRVLKPGATLIDLRPVEDNWSVEIVSSAGWQASGRLSDMPVGMADDEAANQAMREVASRGWFIQIKAGEIPFFYYWNTPSEMKEFIDTEWEDFEKLDEDVYKQTAALWASSNADARVRIRMKIQIAIWKKEI